MMAQAIRMGGGPHPPVSLDPVQSIVNVSWSIPKFLAIELSILRRDPSDPSRAWSVHNIACSPPDPVQSWQYALFLQSFQYQWDGGEPPSVAQAYTNAWSGTAPIAEIVGLPTLPIVHSYPGASHPARVTIGPPHASLHPRAAWDDDTGAVFSPDVTVPNNAEKFEIMSSATLQLAGLSFVDTACDNILGLRAVLAKNLIDDPTETLTPFAPLVIDLSAITITALNRQWRQVAAKIIHNTNPSRISNGSVWVLFERIEETS